MTGEGENIAEDVKLSENELPVDESSEGKEKEEKKKLARLHKRLATTLTEAVTGESADAMEEAISRKRLRSSVGGEPESPKIIMRISKGKVTENTGSESEEDSNRKLRKRKEDVPGEEGEDEKRPRLAEVEEKVVVKTPGRKKKSVEGEGLSVKSGDLTDENFCWTCHRPEAVVSCATCPRMYHPRCVTRTPQDLCPECSAALVAESENRGQSSKRLKLDQLCTLLNFTLDRMKNVPDSEMFWRPVDPEEEPLYYTYIRNPMDLTKLSENIKKRVYGSTIAFLADAKWIMHNSIVFNSTQSPLTSTARALLKVCRQELEEIEKCADCYLNAHTKSDWFLQVCQKPHLLIWARLKGFPFWPAKSLTVNLKTQMVDARFFGAHDKAWVPVRDCYLLSTTPPPSGCKKRGGDLDGAFAEMNEHIDKIRAIFGSFEFAEDRVPYVPEMGDAQLQAMIPGWIPTIKTPGKTIKPVPSGGVVTISGPELSPEDQVVQDLERMAAREAAQALNQSFTDETTSTDGDEVPEGRIPEHAYSITAQEAESAEAEKTASEAVEPEKAKPDEGEKGLDETVAEEDTPAKVSEPVQEVKKKKKKKKKLLEEKETEGEEDPIAVPAAQPPSEPEAAGKGLASETDSSVAGTTASDSQQTLTADSSSIAESSDVEVKQENFDQYLEEENQNEVEQIPKVGETEARKPMVTIVDLKRLSSRSPKEQASSTEAKKPKGDGKVRLTNEVSLLVVDGDGKSSSASSGPPQSPIGKPRKLLNNKARKNAQRLSGRSENPGNSVTISTSSNNVSAKGGNSNVNIISVDTRNSDEQRILLKSLCLEERKGRKETVQEPSKKPTTNSQKQTSNSKPTTTPTNQKAATGSAHQKAATVAANQKAATVVANQKAATAVANQKAATAPANQKATPIPNPAGGAKDGSSQQKTVPSMPALQTTLNGPVFISSHNGQAFIANPQNPNLAFTQNNLGQLSLVQLTNLSSGIHTNFVNLANDTIGVQNQYPTLFNPNAPPPLSPFSSPTGGVLIGPPVSPSPTNGKPERPKSPRPGSISVKTAASLGLSPVVPSPSTSSSDPAVDPLAVDVQRCTAKISEIVTDAIQSILKKMAEDGQPEARLRLLTAEMAKMTWQHKKTIEDMKKQHERKLGELRIQLETESQKALKEAREEMKKEIDETKKKQWCALCRKEALFYCCWNTSYCDYPCQQQHWPQHMSACAQLVNPPLPNPHNPQAKRKFSNSPAYVPIIRPGPGQSSSFPSKPLQMNNFQSLALTTYSGPNSKKKQ